MSENRLFSEGQTLRLPEPFRMPATVDKQDKTRPAVVLGSPGSGKTTLLRFLAREAIRELGSKAVLALTSSRASATELRDALVLDSGFVSEGPRARSISSLAFWILDQKAQKEQSVRPSLLSGANQQELIRKLIDEAISEKLDKNWGIPKATLSLQGFASELRDQITVLLENQISLAELRSLQSKFPGLRLGPAMDIYPRYLLAIEERQLLDSSQLIVKANAVLRDSAILLEDLRLVLLDDAQELTAAGLALVETISKSANVLFFADPDATVLGFRGAIGGKLVPALEAFLPKLQKLSIDSDHFVRSKEIADLMRKVTNRIPVNLSGMQRKVSLAVPDAIC